MPAANHEKKDGPRKRGFGPQALGRSVRKVAVKGAGRRPPLLTNLTLDWPGVVGNVIGSRTLPIKLVGGGSTPEGGRRPQTLLLKVDGAWASEVDHQTPVLIERINAYFGWRVIDRIALKQGFVAPQAKARKKRAVPTPAIRRRVDALTAGIATEDLRATLGRLGERLLSENARENARGSDKT